MPMYYCTVFRTYDEDEGEELFEAGLIDECGNWIDHSTCIGMRRN